MDIDVSGLGQFIYNDDLYICIYSVYIYIYIYIYIAEDRSQANILQQRCMNMLLLAGTLLSGRPLTTKRKTAFLVEARRMKMLTSSNWSRREFSKGGKLVVRRCAHDEVNQFVVAEMCGHTPERRPSGQNADIWWPLRSISIAIFVLVFVLLFLGLFC